MDYITDFDTYMKMKAEQKAIAQERISNRLINEYKASEDGQRSPSFRWSDEAWKNYLRLPAIRYHNDDYVRHFNIVYAMVRGKSYKQVENKVRPKSFGGKGKPVYSLVSRYNWATIKAILEMWNVDPNKIVFAEDEVIGYARPNQSEDNC